MARGRGGGGDLANLRTGISEVFFEVLNFENLHFGGTVNCAVLF